MNISNRFKVLRKNLGVTQAIMAQDLGIDRSHVANIEGAYKNASDSLIKHICVRYGVSESWLKDGKGEMFIPPEKRVEQLLTQLQDQPSIDAYYSLLVGSNLPLQDKLPKHLQAQAQLLQQRKEAIKEDWKQRNPALNFSVGATLNDHELAVEADVQDLEEMKIILEELFNASPSYWEWAKIQFRYAFPEAVVAQARALLKSSLK